jgi:hypothetical protein
MVLELIERNMSGFGCCHQATSLHIRYCSSSFSSLSARWELWWRSALRLELIVA